MGKTKIGKVTHFFPKVSAAIVQLSAGLKPGEKIAIEGHGNSFEQTVESMEIDREPIEEGKAGQAIGLKVNEAVKEGDVVYKVEEA